MANRIPQRRLTNNFKLFENIFSEESVIRELCKERAKLAKKRNEKEFLQRISRNTGAQREGRIEDLRLAKMFPPRKTWHSRRPRERRSRSSYDLNQQALFRTVVLLRAKSPHESWAVALSAQVEKIRQRVLFSEPFNFSPPKVTAVEKPRAKHKFRPLASFCLEDKIIDCLTARYLRRVLDRAFLPSCLAFRCSRGNKQPPTIHDALRKIVNLNRRYRKVGLSVAECDIKSFFDCVSHQVARTSLDELIRDAKLKGTKAQLHPRAMLVFEAYLRAYSFQKSVKSAEERLLVQQDPKGEFKWPKRDLEKLYGSPEPKNVGVPQGGALSCLIANAVLHSADKSLDDLRRQCRHPFTYMRYCDDMIILAKDGRTCQAAYRRYTRVLKGKLLPAHDPEEIARYSAEFWKAKSKLPYHWGRPSGTRVNVPWVQFLGYQVRYDGLVRVRPASMKKQIKKITRAADELLKTLNPGYRKGRNIPPFSSGLRKSNKQIIHRFRLRLISIGAGRVRLGREHSEPMPMCWANGFRGLLGQKLIPSGLKTLDRHQERQIHRVARRLLLRENTPAEGKKARSVCRYYGTPFSYWGQFHPRSKARD